MKKLNSEIGAEENEKLKTEKALKENENSTAVPLTYEEINLQYGLVFKDVLVEEKVKPKKLEFRPEEFSIKAVNTVSKLI